MTPSFNDSMQPLFTRLMARLTKSRARSIRLLATQSAEKWLEDRISVARRRLSDARRESSTQEVIEISTGARARNRLLDKGRSTAA